jgi:hypothetical protein
MDTNLLLAYLGVGLMIAPPDSEVLMELLFREMLQ